MDETDVLLNSIQMLITRNLKSLVALYMYSETEWVAPNFAPSLVAVLSERSQNMVNCM